MPFHKISTPGNYVKLRNFKLCNLTLFTVFLFQIPSKGYCESHNEVEYLALAGRPMRFELGTFRSWMYHFNSLSYSGKQHDKKLGLNLLQYQSSNQRAKGGFIQNIVRGSHFCLLTHIMMLANEKINRKIPINLNKITNVYNNF